MQFLFHHLHLPHSPASLPNLLFSALRIRGSSIYIGVINSLEEGFVCYSGLSHNFPEMKCRYLFVPGYKILHKHCKRKSILVRFVNQGTLRHEGRKKKFLTTVFLLKLTQMWHRVSVRVRPNISWCLGLNSS